MPVNPQFLSARAAERRFRDLAHLRALAWLPLKRAGAVVVRTPCVPLTLRHMLELRARGNAFFTRRPVLLGDVFLFLWRLHPLYRVPRLGREQLVAHIGAHRARLLRLWLAMGSLRAALCHRRLTAHVRRCDLFAAVLSIREFLDATDQDQSGDDLDAGAGRCISAVAPDRHLPDNLVDWLMATYHMSHDEALDFPIAVGNQLYRERLLQTPDGELAVFAPSDSLL